ncbi:Fip1-domain-containing protein, partial [Rhizopus microsporus var. microsporus]
KEDSLERSPVEEKQDDKSEVDVQVINERQEDKSESESEDDLEIILEPEEDNQNETENEKQQSEKTASDETKEALVNIKPGQQTKTTATPTANTSSNANQSSKTAQGGINLEGIGEYNGQPITEVNLDDFEDKPWRKPGADITDYFNYGFNEVTWRAYCAKQKLLRENKKVRRIVCDDSTIDHFSSLWETWACQI